MRTALVVLGLAAAAYAGLPPSGNQMCRRVAKHSLVGLASHGSAVGLPVEPTGHGGDRWVEGLAVASAPDGSLAVLESVGMWGVSGIVCHSLDVKDGTAPPSLAPRQWRMPMPSGGGQDPSAPGFAEGLTVVSAGAGQASARAFQLTYRKGVVHEYAVEPRKEGSPRGLPVGEQEAVQAAEQRRAAAEAAASSRVQAAEEAAEAAEAAAEADAAAVRAATRAAEQRENPSTPPAQENPSTPPAQENPSTPPAQENPDTTATAAPTPASPPASPPAPTPSSSPPPPPPAVTGACAAIALRHTGSKPVQRFSMAGQPMPAPASPPAPPGGLSPVGVSSSGGGQAQGQGPPAGPPNGLAELASVMLGSGFGSDGRATAPAGVASKAGRARSDAQQLLDPSDALWQRQPPAAAVSRAVGSADRWFESLLQAGSSRRLRVRGSATSSRAAQEGSAADSRAASVSDSSPVGGAVAESLALGPREGWGLAQLPAAALGDLSGGPPVLVSSDGTGRLYLHSMEGMALPGGVKSLVLGRGAAAAAARCGCLASVGDAWLRPNELEAVKVSDAFGVESLSESSMVDEAAAPPANATPAASPSASAPSPTAAPTKQATSSPVPAPSVVAEPSAEPPASLLETKASLRRAQEDEEPDRAEQEGEEPDRAEQEGEEPDRAEQEDEEPDRAEQEGEEPDRAEQEGEEPDRAEQEDEDPAPTKAAADRSWRWEVWAALYASAEPCIVRVAVLPDSDAWPVVGVIGFDAASAAMAEAGLRASMSGSNLNGVAFASGGGPGKGWAIITGKMWRGMYAFRTSDGVAGGSAGSEE